MNGVIGRTNLPRKAENQEEDLEPVMNHTGIYTNIVFYIHFYCKGLEAEILIIIRDILSTQTHYIISLSLVLGQNGIWIKWHWTKWYV